MNFNLLNILTFDNKSIFDRLQAFTNLNSGAPAANSENPDTSLTPLNATDNLNIVNQEVLSKLNDVLGPSATNAVQKYNPDDFSPQNVDDRILGFISQALNNARQNGADHERLQNLLQQARDGIEKGFSDARDVLGGLGVLNGQVEQDIHDTHDLIQSGLGKLEQGLLPRESVPTALFTEQAISADYSKSLSLSLQIQTNDGDVVTLTLDSSQATHNLSYSAQDATSRLDYNEHSIYTSASFSLSVEGNLDKDELRAIGKLMHKVDRLADKFFNGDVQKAFARANHLKLDSSELAAFSLNLQSTQTKQVAGAYNMVSTLGGSPALSPPDLSPAGDLIAGLEQTRQLPEVQGFVKDAGQLVNKLFENAVRLKPEFNAQASDLQEAGSIKLGDILAMLTHGDKHDHHHDHRDHHADREGRHGREHRHSKAA